MSEYRYELRVELQGDDLIHFKQRGAEATIIGPDGRVLLTLDDTEETRCEVLYEGLPHDEWVQQQWCLRYDLFALRPPKVLTYVIQWGKR